MKIQIWSIVLLILIIPVSAIQPAVDCCLYYIVDEIPPSDMHVCYEFDFNKDNKERCNELVQERNDEDQTSVILDILMFIILLGISIWRISSIGLKRYFRLRWYWLLIFWFIAIISIPILLFSALYRSCGVFYECTSWYYLREYLPLVLFLFLFVYTVTNITIYIYDKIKKK